jgi:ribonuclease R
MADDYYRFNEQNHSLFGENTRKVYRLGDRINVQVVRVDQERRQIDLAIEDILVAVRGDEERRGPRRSHARVKKQQRKETPEQRRKTKAARLQRKQRPGRRERSARKR